ncbi:MAG: DUF5058 family protein [Spirochaetes bacterium]|uniref:DUF5058 family protein n=1 Tax=Candidatus Aphodenecus pullistercoris TaxID=2840669 RepID=A0A9D9HA99_9SPIR|nr:DUF5058 family protein [Candidatus Aphodenecus pullistercoris]
MSYLDIANSTPLYLVVGVILLFIAALCVVFIVKSWRAGIAIGMDRKVLRKAVTKSATFTLLPSLSILLGVIALAGSLGVPVAWLRLSVIGNLQYEATVAEMAAENMGVALDSSILTPDHLVTILAVMTFGIIWGCLLSIFTMKKYSSKVAIGKKSSGSGGGFASIAMTAMMIGLCSTFVGSYLSQAIRTTTFVPFLTALIASIFMAILDTLAKKSRLQVLDSFSLALSMLAGMAGSVFLTMGGIR